MSNQQGGPPRGAFGPGHTVLAPPSLADEAPRSGGGAVIPPATVRDPAAGPAPYASPYVADPAPGVGIPPPPPARGRPRRRGQGPSLVVIGAISFVVIGAGVTTLAVVTSNSGDDKPMPTVDVPASVSVPPDPGAAASPTDQPTTEPPPVPPARTPGKPGLRPVPRPGSPRPGPNNPRYPGPGPGPGPRRPQR